MKSTPVRDRLRDEQTLATHLAELGALDPCLIEVIEQCLPVPLRAEEGGFRGLSRIVIGQLLSVQSAKAIWERFCNVLGEVNAERYLCLGEEGVAGIGLSNAKFHTIRAIANAEIGQTLRYDLIERSPLNEAMRTLTSIKGIGPWTAEVYLSFCVGHEDIFPAGDLALRKIVAHHLELDDTPSISETIKLTQKWSPYRGAAARLMWRYYALVKQREGILL
ncbi:DNA-3-methyladenine glycosylase family protein [Maritalea sp.]|uniref:DNA-3-methyladenine glycosylase family protein n=1 Tax=Maritalea sp. TaxID=2003361 RepID=UPI003EF6D23C